MELAITLRFHRLVRKLFTDCLCIKHTFKKANNEANLDIGCENVTNVTAGSFFHYNRIRLANVSEVYTFENLPDAKQIRKQLCFMTQNNKAVDKSDLF